MKTALAVVLLLQLGGLDEPPKKAKQFVRYAAEQQVVPAGRHAVLELRFRLEDGYHVNSHVPKSDLQIATKVELGEDAGVTVAALEYPAGKSYRLAAEPSEMLDVYTDEFVVRAPVVAAKGEHELKGWLTYQACDRAACYPAKRLAVDVVFTAK